MSFLTSGKKTCHYIEQPLKLQVCRVAGENGDQYFIFKHNFFAQFDTKEQTSGEMSYELRLEVFSLHILFLWVIGNLFSGEIHALFASIKVPRIAGCKMIFSISGRVENANQENRGILLLHHQNISTRRTKIDNGSWR
jgi:hypothetical protein